jgi:UDP-MurNAc hydroxylase
MKIHFINHASVCIEYKDVFLVTDPWLEGNAFDNGWSLIAPTKFKYDDFEKVTHIWFSHEHPDHFSTYVINKIPQEYKSKITIIYQYTIDKKVYNYCQKQGFKEIIEISPAEKLFLSQYLYVQCEHFSEGDSWLYVNIDGFGILNLNDCIIRDLDENKSIQSKLENVDLLFTQFSFAHKVGNVNEHTKRIEKVKEKIQRIKNQIHVFKPKYLIPFASFVYFSHRENFYMNTNEFPLRFVVEEIKNTFKIDIIILKPGDIWPVLQDYSAIENLIFYESLYLHKINEKRFRETKSVELRKLTESSEKYVNKLKIKNPTIKQLFRKLDLVFFLTDYNTAFKFDINSGIIESNVKYEDATISISSEALMYLFNYEWGGATCHVNARYIEIGDGYAFNLLIKIGILNNQGDVFKWNKPSILNRIKSKFIH